MTIFTINSRYIILYLALIGITAFIIRFFYYPFGVPLNADALFYFWYSTDINYLGHLPNDWTPLNNGWPALNSIIFPIFSFNNTFAYMDMQRFFSIFLSIITIVPIFFLCKKFVKDKFALVGAAIFAFDPRLIVNSLLGTTDPLYILLVATSLALFLQSNKKIIYISFIIVGLSALVRGEGLFLFFPMSIMFIVRFRKEPRFVSSRFLLIIFLFMLIVLPMSFYRIDILGNDGIFLRISSSLVNISSEVSNANGIGFLQFLLNTFEVFFKYLGWIFLPTLIFFVPIGAILIFKQRTFEKYTIILSLGFMSLPALVSYSIPALDTRYLYYLFPMFCILSVIMLNRFLESFQKQNLVIILIIIGILVTSLLFYDYVKIDYNYELEAYEIANHIVNTSHGVNYFTESNYVLTAQLPNDWPFLYSNLSYDVSIIETTNFSSIKELIENSKQNGLTHLVVDENTSQQQFLYELFFNESKYPYLIKEFDSKDLNYDYHVKIFKIDYEKLS